MKACAFAEKLTLDSSDVTIRNAGASFNATGSDFNAFYTKDSSVLFSSLRSNKIEENLSIDDDTYYIQLYEVKKEAGNWGLPTKLDTVINKEARHIANGTYNQDKTTFYFSVCNENFQCLIYASDLRDGQWQTAKPLGPEINFPESSNTQPFFAEVQGKDILYFVSNRPRGKGGLDLWYAELNAKRIKVKNLGKNVNSLDNEISPFYDSKTNTLYFSSSWHYGLGGMDIFKSEGGFKPAKPHNLGKPFNSVANDMYYNYNDV